MAKLAPFTLTSQSAAPPSQSSLARVSAVPGATMSGFIRPSAVKDIELSLCTRLKLAVVQPTVIPLKALPGPRTAVVNGLLELIFPTASEVLIPRS